MTTEDLPGSFRDPSGFLFYHNNLVYRQVNLIYKDNYDHLMSSGLYRDLENSGLLIPHEEVNNDYSESDKTYKILKPKQIPFISYPYEWSFSQLKHAALTTLEVQKKAFNYGMILKDSSAYNIQFVDGKPVFIDTLSFDRYREGQTWVAYRQFCQHFLASLALMSYKDVRLNQMFRIYIDGVPLDLASSLLPFGSRFRFSLFSHIHLHSRSQKHFDNKTVDVKAINMKSQSFLGLIDNLESAVKKLNWKTDGTEWGDYYDDTNYCSDALSHKKQTVSKYIEMMHPKSVWDIGGNIGVFSRIASDNGIKTISFDIDPAAVEKNYITSVEQNERNILPLLLDLTNPSPGIGWTNNERTSLIERGPADTVLALALIHHLAISNNVTLNKIADFLSRICKSLIIEFVPKNDSQVQRLLSTRNDTFPDYTQSAFESEFSKFFTIRDSVKVKNSERLLYLMVKKES